jgi:hypothetical protein
MGRKTRHYDCLGRFTYARVWTWSGSRAAGEDGGGEAAARGEFAADDAPFGLNGGDDVAQHFVDGVFVEDALAAISAFGARGAEIRLQYFVYMCAISYKKLELRRFICKAKLRLRPNKFYVFLLPCQILNSY